MTDERPEPKGINPDLHQWINELLPYMGFVSARSQPLFDKPLVEVRLEHEEHGLASITVPTAIEYDKKSLHLVMIMEMENLIEMKKQAGKPEGTDAEV